jgi:hypothetical protein
MSRGNGFCGAVFLERELAGRVKVQDLAQPILLCLVFCELLANYTAPRASATSLARPPLSRRIRRACPSLCHSEMVSSGTLSNAAERALPAISCTGCEAFAECDAAATPNRERFSTWAGRDRTRPPRKAAAA